MKLKKKKKKLWETLGNKYLTKTIETKLHMKRLFNFCTSNETTLGEYLNNFTTLLADLLNADMTIDDEDTTMLLMNSLQKEYDNWCGSYIIGRTFKYEEVILALINHNHKRYTKKELFVHRRTESLTARDKLECRDTDNRRKSPEKFIGNHNTDEDECTFCNEKLHQ